MTEGPTSAGAKIVPTPKATTGQSGTKYTDRLLPEREKNSKPDAAASSANKPSDDSQFRERYATVNQAAANGRSVHGNPPKMICGR